MQGNVEMALADVFNQEYQAQPYGADWIDVMQAVARRIAVVLHPDSNELQARFLSDANMSGLFADQIEYVGDDF